MTSISELLDAKKAKEPDTQDVDVLIGDEAVTLRFAKLDGDRWAELCGKNPPRLDNPTDLRIGGYNLDEVAKAAAKINGRRIDGDTSEELTGDQWDDLFELVSGHDVKSIKDAIWDLNEWQPIQRLEAAKKARAASAATSKSRSARASAPDA